MPRVLSKKQIERFHHDGFLTPIRALSVEAVAKYKKKLEGFEIKYPTERHRLKSKSHLLCPWVDEIARDSHILDIYEDLIGPNIFCYSMAFRIKEPDGSTFAGWHQDGAYNPVKPILVIGALALSECSIKHGCLSVIPGSHKIGTLPHKDTGNPNSILSRGQFITGKFDKSDSVNFELKPGEIGLFYSEIIHGSGVNLADDRRIILLVEMMPTCVEARAHRDTGVLVRGVDRYGRVDIDPSPIQELGQGELEAWKNATRKTGKNIFNDSPLLPTEVYGGNVTVGS